MLIGTLRERLVIQTNTPLAVSVSGLTRTGTTATATTTAAHGYSTGDYVQHAGADQAAYNVKAKVTVTGPAAYTFTVAGTPDTPATGTITALYVSNVQGGVLAPWRTLDTVPAELIPLRAMERFQLAAIQSIVEYRFRVRIRADVSAKMRLLWTPSWPSGAAQKTLEISGVLPCEDRTWMLIESGEVAA